MGPVSVERPNKRRYIGERFLGLGGWEGGRGWKGGKRVGRVNETAYPFDCAATGSSTKPLQIKE